MFDDKLNAILRCPTSRLPIIQMDEAAVVALNALISSGAPPTDGQGRPVSEAVEGAYVREDGLLAFPIRDDLLSLHPDDAISIPSASDSSEE